MKFQFFKTTINQNILIADFHYSKSANAFSLACAKELIEILKLAKKKKCVGFIFTSSDKTFCSGGNLSDYAKLKTKKQGIEINKKISAALKSLENAPFPTVCCISGDCFGGGIELISAFDLILAAPHPLFGFWQRKIGLSLGWGGGSRLVKRIHHKNLIRLMLEAKCFSSYAAKNIGLVDEVLPTQQLLERAQDYIKKQRNLPQIPFEKIKKLGSKNEQKIFESLWLNTEHQRLLSKFR